MRGLVRAGLLLAPALVSAFAVPDFWAEGKHHDQTNDHNHDGKRHFVSFFCICGLIKFQMLHPGQSVLLMEDHMTC